MWNCKDIMSVTLIKIRLAKNNSSLSCGTAMFLHLREILISSYPCCSAQTNTDRNQNQS